MQLNSQWDIPTFREWILSRLDLENQGILYDWMLRGDLPNDPEGDRRETEF